MAHLKGPSGIALAFVSASLIGWGIGTEYSSGATVSSQVAATLWGGQCGLDLNTDCNTTTTDSCTTLFGSAASCPGSDCGYTCPGVLSYKYGTTYSNLLKDRTAPCGTVTKPTCIFIAYPFPLPGGQCSCTGPATPPITCTPSPKVLGATCASGT